METRPCGVRQPREPLLAASPGRMTCGGATQGRGEAVWARIRGDGAGGVRETLHGTPASQGRRGDRGLEGGRDWEETPHAEQDSGRVTPGLSAPAPLRPSEVPGLGVAADGGGAGILPECQDGRLDEGALKGHLREGGGERRWCVQVSV